MNAKQREYFRRKLTSWREELMRESQSTIQNLQQDTEPASDIADRASIETMVPFNRACSCIWLMATYICSLRTLLLKVGANRALGMVSPAS